MCRRLQPVQLRPLVVREQVVQAAPGRVVGAVLDREHLKCPRPMMISSARLDLQPEITRALSCSSDLVELKGVPGTLNNMGTVVAISVPFSERGQPQLGDAEHEGGAARDQRRAQRVRVPEQRRGDREQMRRVRCLRENRRQQPQMRLQQPRALRGAQHSA